MTNENLAIYLNNHLAASVTALELLSSIEMVHANSDVARLASELRAEIEGEQQQLENLMEQLQITKNTPRQVAGWLAEKFAQAKLRWDDSNNGALHLLESLELILIGIEGKRGLWRALSHAAIVDLPLLDYERFAARSEEQQQRVEAVRLAAAKAAFSE